MERLTRLIAAMGLVALVAIAAACGSTSAVQPPADPAVSEAQATDMARAALEGYNAGDYTAFTRDWSPTMKAAISERDFAAFHDQVMAAKGRFVAIQGATLSSRQPGTYGYTFTVAFERGTATYRIVFKGDSPLIEGTLYQ